MERGHVLAGRFEIEETIVSGALSIVYKARDLSSGASVAIKVMVGQGVRDVERFTGEALLLSELRHPGIVRYIDHGVTDAGQLFLAMDWLEGETLTARLARLGMTIDEAITVVKTTASTLSVAHARGVVHRDIKPSNLFLKDCDVADVHILDFGVARLGYGRTLATRAGAMLGTPGYMAPEQAQGRKDVDARADVFSLGCVLYECITGRPAFVGEHVMALLARVLMEEPTRMRDIRSDVPADLEHLVTAMLSKDPALRPRDAAMVAALLEPFGDAVGSRRAPALKSSHAITGYEQRLLCIVLATSSFSADGAESTAPSSQNVTLTPEMLNDLQTQRSTLMRLGRSGQRSSQTGSQSEPLNGWSDIWVPGVRLADLSAEMDRFHGHIERLADGSLLATFSEAAAATDLATRAARAALSLRLLLPDVPIAVATGRGVVSERLPVGDAVERAARVLRAARATPQGSLGVKLHVGLCDVTAGLLANRFAIHEESWGSVLAGDRDSGGVVRTLLGKPSAFVGRERELSTLKAVVDEAFNEPAARAAVITGAAGVGKSRLVHELLGQIRAPGDSEAAAIWTSRGDPLRAGSPFSMLAQILRQAMNFDDVEDAAALTKTGELSESSTTAEAEKRAKGRQEKIRERVSACVESASDAERIAVFLAEVASAPFPIEQHRELAAARRDAMLMGDQIRRALEDWLEAECRARPVLLVLEDLHWGDASTVRCVDALLRHLREQPFCVIAVGRAELARVFPSLWHERAVQELRLGELSRRACERLSRAALGAKASTQLVARLYERSGGSPYFLEELVRAVASGHTDETLPGTILAMVQSRLEELDSEDRRALRAASIFGQTFRPEGLAMLLGEPERVGEARDQIRELVSRELVVRASDRRSQGREEYSFRQDMVREAAYATFTDADKMLGHRLAAVFLEASGEAEPAMLAQHYERGGELARAATWFAKAVDAALKGNDFVGVIHHAERAIACGAAGEVAGRVLLRQAEAHRWRTEFHDAEKRGFEAIKLLHPGSEAWLGAVGEVSTVLGKFGQVDRLIDLGQLLLSHAPSDVSGEAWVIALARSSSSLLMLGRFEMSEALFEALGRALGDPEKAERGPRAWWLRTLAFRAPFRGEIGVSAAYFSESAECFADVGDLRNACLQRANAGASYMEVGAWPAAEETLRRAIVEAERMGAKHIVGSAKRDLGLTLCRLGRLEEARLAEREAVEELSSHGDKRLEAMGRDELANILLLMGDVEGAEQEARLAVDILAQNRPYQCHAQATLAKVLLARGEPRDALRAAEIALGILIEVGSLEEGEGQVRLSLAKALRALGQVDEASAVIAEARAEIERRAAVVTDPEARRSFVEAMPEHVETLALAQAWLGARPTRGASAQAGA